MRFVKHRLAAAALVALPCLGSFLAAAPARAACSIEDKGEVDVITNFFPTLELLAKAMKECEHPGLKVDVKLTTELKTEIPRAFEAARSPFDAAAVATSSIVQLQAKGQLLRLNDLVAKYKDKYHIEDQMLIRFGDDIMAIAFMGNAQVLYYRKDILAKHHLQVPTTYDEVLSNCEVLKKDEPGIDHCFSAAYGNSWELGNEFVDMYIGMGGQLADPSSSEPAFASPTGVATLEKMKQLLGHMSPNALAIDFGGVKQELQQGRTAMAFLWGDIAATMDSPAESTVVGKVGFAPAPAAKAGGPAATLLWWDGYVIPKNLDGDPDLAFRLIMEATRSSIVTENNDITLWLRSNYKPTQYAKAVVDSAAAHAPPFPMTPQADIALLALGEHISNYLANKQTARQSLDDAASAYRQSAKAAGYLN